MVTIKNRFTGRVILKLDVDDLRESDLRGSDLRGSDLRGSDLRESDLRGVDLRGANLSGAALDFSAMPLWCGDLKACYDDAQVIQQLYHVLSHAQNSPNVGPRLKRALLTPELVALANEFHRADECGKLEALKSEAGND